MTFSFDEDALKKMVAGSAVFKRIEADANDTLRQLLRDVNRTHAGRPVAEVDAELRSRFAAANMEPAEPTFSQTVQSISDRTLTE